MSHTVIEFLHSIGRRGDQLFEALSSLNAENLFNIISLALLIRAEFLIKSGIQIVNDLIEFLSLPCGIIRTESEFFKNSGGLIDRSIDIFHDCRQHGGGSSSGFVLFSEAEQGDFCGL